MKKILLLSGVLCVFSASAQFGFQFAGGRGVGLGKIHRTVPGYTDIMLNVFFKYRGTPFGFGAIMHNQGYASTSQDGVAFYRDNYPHNVANVTNSNRLSSVCLYARYEFRNGKVFSPFIDLGGGQATYRNSWSAKDPFTEIIPSSDPDEPSVSDGHYEASGSIMLSTVGFFYLSSGINVKFENLAKDWCGPGIWLTLGVDLHLGGNVRHLNTEINPWQFAYDQGNAGSASLPVHPHHPVNVMPNPLRTDGPADPYLAQPNYMAPHRFVVFRVGISLFLRTHCPD